jgi:phage-related minor tail protein
MANIAAKNLAASLFGQNNGQSSIGGLLSGLFGGGSSSTGASTTTLGNDVSLAFADGGLPPVGRTSLVGERGPELFVPNTAGRIIPNHMLGGGQRGNTIIENHGARVQEKKQPNGDIRYVIDAVRNEIAAGLASGTGVEAQALRSRGVSLDRSLARRA